MEPFGSNKRDNTLLFALSLNVIISLSLAISSCQAFAQRKATLKLSNNIIIFILRLIVSLVDILDTSGDVQFPAMRRLSIATAHAFMLVYASTSASSFQCVKQCFQEIGEQHADYQLPKDIPIVIAGNKSDLANTHREARLEEVTDWVYCELARLRAKVLECSAKEDQNVTDLFKTLLSLSRFLPDGSNNDGTSGRKRRSSAYVSASSSINLQHL